jgi:hypothetical protein
MRSTVVAIFLASEEASRAGRQAYSVHAVARAENEMLYYCTSDSLLALQLNISLAKKFYNHCS